MALICSMIVMLCLGETCVGKNFAAINHESGQIAAVNLESTSDFKGAYEYDASGYAIAPNTTPNWGVNTRFTKTQYQAPGGRGTGQNYTVYQQNIDWNLSVGGKTNLERALDGGTPYIMKNGRAAQINLHHSRQDARGSLFEVSNVTHRARTGAGREALHPYGRNQHPDFPVDRKAFGVDRNQYWTDRATEAQRLLGQ